MISPSLIYIVFQSLVDFRFLKEVMSTNLRTVLSKAYYLAHQLCLIHLATCRISFYSKDNSSLWPGLWNTK